MRMTNRMDDILIFFTENPEYVRIIGIILLILGMVLAIKLAKLVLKIIFTVVAISGIATTAFGEQIVHLIQNMIEKIN